MKFSPELYWIILVIIAFALGMVLSPFKKVKIVTKYKYESAEKKVTPKNIKRAKVVSFTDEELFHREKQEEGERERY